MREVKCGMFGDPNIDAPKRYFQNPIRRCICLRSWLTVRDRGNPVHDIWQRRQSVQPRRTRPERYRYEYVGARTNTECECGHDIVLILTKGIKAQSICLVSTGVFPVDI